MSPQIQRVAARGRNLLSRVVRGALLATGTVGSILPLLMV